MRRSTKKKPVISAVLLGLIVALMQDIQAQESGEGVRTIHLTQDDGQVRYETRIFELKHATADDMLPFVRTAVLRYSANSNAQKVTGENGNHEIIVSTGVKFMPYVEQIVAALDHESPVNQNGQAIQGTGVERIAYEPKYRAAAQFSDLIGKTLSSDSGKAFVNPTTNVISWQDQKQAAENTLDWVKRLDRPLPQANIRLNYYELRESDLKDLGMDYLAWKNGPGVNLFNAGFNAGHILVNETLYKAMTQVPFSMANSWAFGGFFTAPMFDMSFIRCLQQSGQASIAADANVTALSTPIRTQDEYMDLLVKQSKNPDTAPYVYKVNMTPEYQNIAKNTLGRQFVGKSFKEDEGGEEICNPPTLQAKIINPFICFAANDEDRDTDGFIPDTPEYYNKMHEIRESGGVLFNYELYFKDVVERGNTGIELSNSSVFSGATTIGFNEEKVLSVYEKENDVEQIIGLPILSRIPIIKYFASTTTHIRERTYIIITAEALPVHPNMTEKLDNNSTNTKVFRRIEKIFKKTEEELEQEALSEKNDEVVK